MDENTKACKLCLKGFYSPGGNLSCESCERTTYTERSGQSKCKKCPEFFMSNYENSGCEECQPGEYFDIDAKMCIVCDENTITTQPSQLQCIPCKPDEHTESIRNKCFPGAPKPKSPYKTWAYGFGPILKRHNRNDNIYNYEKKILNEIIYD